MPWADATRTGASNLFVLCIPVMLIYITGLVLRALGHSPQLP